MRTFAIPIILATACGAVVVVAAATETTHTDVLQSPGQRWTYEQYPSIEDSPEVCRTKGKRLCDPDSILDDNQVARLDELLETPRSLPMFLACPTQDDAEADEDISFEIAIALAKKIDLTDHVQREHPEERAAKEFAVHLHDTWGVGQTTDCGSTGVLIFLSERDRAIYVSRGDALAGILTDRRLDLAIENMKPFLQNGNMAEALTHVIGEIEFLLKSGPPETWEIFGGWISKFGGLFWIFGMLGCARFQSRRAERNQRAYAQVQSQLSEIDEARARALQGQFQTKSCPICLEAFPEPVEHAVAPGEQRSSESATTADSPRDKLGSDGKPLKLLRCGHVFDATCWDEWVNSGRGQVNKCPICKVDVGSTRVVNSEGSAVVDRSNIVQRSVVRDRNVSIDSDSAEEQSYRAQRQRQALTYHRNERLFRLSRLGRRYPTILESRSIERWSAPNYEGSLVRDPDFVRRNPATSSSSGGHSRPNSSSSFGGGSSGGGRSGRW